MTTVQILQYLLVWTAAGVTGFSLYIVVVFRTGIVYNTRNQDGLLKKKQDLSGILSSLSLLLLILLLQFISNYWLLRIQGVQLTFPGLFFLNYVLYLLLFFYDTFIIDYLVIGRWRPAFLILPEEMNAESMAEHIRISLVVGPILGIVVILLGSLISYFWFG